MSSDPPSDKASIFLKALRGVLRPLVRALVAQGIGAPAFYRLVKQTYVDVAAETLGQGATDSRISVMTGVHRRDVKDMRATSLTDDADIRRKVSTLTTVVGRWLGGDDTTDDTGQPIPLPRSRAEGVSFEALVQSVSRDIRPRTILDELLRQKIVTRVDDMVHLNLDSLIGPADLDQRMHFFAANLGDHMNAAVENLLEDAPTNLERAVFYNNLTDQSIAKIEAEARLLSNDALMKINKQARALQDADSTLSRNTNSFRFGVFFFHAKAKDGTKGTNDNDIS